MSALEQVPGQLSNEGYPFINGVPVPMPDINSIHAIEARRVEANTGGSYLEHIASRMAIGETVDNSEIVLAEPPVHRQLVEYQRTFLISYFGESVRNLRSQDVERLFEDLHSGEE